MHRKNFLTAAEISSQFHARMKVAMIRNPIKKNSTTLGKKMRFRVCDKGVVAPVGQRTLYVSMPMFGRSSTYFKHIFDLFRNHFHMPIGDESAWLRNHKVQLLAKYGRVVVRMSTCPTLPEGYAFVSKKVPERLKEWFQDNLRPSVLLRSSITMLGAAGVMFSTKVLLLWMFKEKVLQFRIGFLLYPSIAKDLRWPIGYSFVATSQALLVRSLDRELILQFALINQVQLLTVVAIHKSSNWDENALHSLVKGVLEYLEAKFAVIAVTASNDPKWNGFQKVTNPTVVTTIDDLEYISKYFVCASRWMWSQQVGSTSPSEALESYRTAMKSSPRTLNTEQDKLAYLDTRTRALEALLRVEDLKDRNTLKHFFDLPALPIHSQKQRLCKHLGLAWHPDKVSENFKLQASAYYALLQGFCQQIPLGQGIPTQDFENLLNQIAQRGQLFRETGAEQPKTNTSDDVD
jgi:hypothetical protein